VARWPWLQAEGDARMLIQVTETTTLNAPKYPRLNYVLGALEQTFRPKRRAHAADPESTRNIFVAMCRFCPWERENRTNSNSASDDAKVHERNAHGNHDGGLVRVECR
jgi:hypothetical protein